MVNHQPILWAKPMSDFVSYRWVDSHSGYRSLPGLQLFFCQPQFCYQTSCGGFRSDFCLQFYVLYVFQGFLTVLGTCNDSCMCTTFMDLVLCMYVRMYVCTYVFISHFCHFAFEARMGSCGIFQTAILNYKLNICSLEAQESTRFKNITNRPW